MEESRALSKLSDATDLLVFLEDILNPSSLERLSDASWSGVRITLRNARTALQESQTVLSKEFVSRSRGATVSINSTPAANVSSTGMSANGITAIQPDTRKEDAIINNPSASTFDKAAAEQSKVQITRRDLKATLERFIESR